ncbi:fimbrial protein [Vibrio sp. 10N.286.49.B3]|uniref:Flp family type IVb pilin n=1 Tax=Vibrio sp. 10N.286.49.B3 TaxID=1880855 RepID=UPI000CBB0BB7|nr:Flp family type IVb pilin [Vibrio sp. 10N.286.49.B3]PMH41248.1 fimbrial protein [Vibrio sp. 10N.286.49.B3]
MKTVLNNIKAFMRDEEGLTVVEYVIGAALLVAALTAVFGSLKTDLAEKLTSTISSIGK